MNLKRFERNPLLSPIREHSWESETVFNPAVLYIDGKIHVVYRAQGRDRISRLGYALFDSELHLIERLSEPIYLPSSSEETLGCEDPRMVLIGNRIFMLYTAYGKIPLSDGYYKIYQVAITSINLSDFLSKRWNWSEPAYPFPHVADKDAVIFPEMFNGRWVMYHRIFPHIWISYSDDGVNWGDSNIFLSPKYDWEYFKIGVGAPPIKTQYGWIVFYHGVDRNRIYRLGYFVVALDDPTNVLYRSPEPILEPVEQYERYGDVNNVVFTCGAVLIGEMLFVFYGAADKVIGVARADIRDVVLPLKWFLLG